MSACNQPDRPGLRSLRFGGSFDPGADGRVDLSVKVMDSRGQQRTHDLQRKAPFQARDFHTGPGGSLPR
jgi:hypothetical protein